MVTLNQIHVIPSIKYQTFGIPQCKRRTDTKSTQSRSIVIIYTSTGYCLTGRCTCLQALRWRQDSGAACCRLLLLLLIVVFTVVIAVATVVRFHYAARPHNLQTSSRRSCKPLTQSRPNLPNKTAAARLASIVVGVVHEAAVVVLVV